jgi:hypothetical protein
MKRTSGAATSMWRRAALALDEAPREHWVYGLVHHGSRMLLLLVTAVTVFLLFPAPRLPDAAVLERGVVAPHDVIAEFSFEIPKSPDELLREQVEAASGVPPVYAQSPAAADSVIAGVRSLFMALDTIIRTTEREERRTVVRSFMERNRLSPTSASLDLLLEPAPAPPCSAPSRRRYGITSRRGWCRRRWVRVSPPCGCAARREWSGWSPAIRCSRRTASSASPPNAFPAPCRSSPSCSA